MTIRKSVSMTLLGSAAAVFFLAAPAVAQVKIAPEDQEAVTEGQPDRYSIVSVDGDILRVDRQNGTVSICREQNRSWRCNPVPLAEEAYIAEINELAAEVDRLTARLEQLEGDEGVDGSAQSPESDLKQPVPDSEDGNRTSRWSEEEEELERMLTFTESAMRRFFGMVRELQKDFEQEGN